MANRSPPQPKWLVDLSTPPITKPNRTTYADPPGYTTLKATSSKSKSAVATPRKPPTPAQMDTLKLKKAWEIALAPAKQLPMNAIGMYMSGNSLQIFSIMMVFMLFKGPILAVLGIQGTFQRLESPGIAQQMLLVKAAFVGCNMLALALGIWKVNGMGLLPYVSPLSAWNTPSVLTSGGQDHKIRLAGMGGSERSHRTCHICILIPAMKSSELMIPIARPPRLPSQVAKTQYPLMVCHSKHQLPQILDPRKAPSQQPWTPKCPA